MLSRRLIMRQGLTALAVSTLGGCGSTSRLRYRMTVSVNTPTGIRSGSAVREITHYRPPNIPMLGESRQQWRVLGEAVSIEVRTGQYLYALLTGGDGVPDFSSRVIDSIFRQVDRSGNLSKIEVWPSHPVTRRPNITTPFPMLATFRNMSDPETAEIVIPTEIESVYGKGFSLRSIYISRTRDPLTDKIDTQLKWLSHDNVINRNTWLNLPYNARQIISGLRSSGIGETK